MPFSITGALIASVIRDAALSSAPDVSTNKSTDRRATCAACLVAAPLCPFGFFFFLFPGMACRVSFPSSGWSQAQCPTVPSRLSPLIGAKPALRLPQLGSFTFPGLPLDPCRIRQCLMTTKASPTLQHVVDAKIHPSGGRSGVKEETGTYVALRTWSLVSDTYPAIKHPELSSQKGIDVHLSIAHSKRTRKSGNERSESFEYDYRVARLIRQRRRPV
jgi:hypothetical protein